MRRIRLLFHQVDLVFVTDCVLHCWTEAADWYDSPIDRAARLSFGEVHKANQRFEKVSGQ
jgi:hypothetical protein